MLDLSTTPCCCFSLCKHYIEKRLRDETRFLTVLCHSQLCSLCECPSNIRSCPAIFIIDQHNFGVLSVTMSDENVQRRILILKQSIDTDQNKLAPSNISLTFSPLLSANKLNFPMLNISDNYQNMIYSCTTIFFVLKLFFTFQFMASESSLLQKWHPAYRTSASGIQLEIARHPAYQKGGFHPQTSD